jgi:hypothetical protein
MTGSNGEDWLSRTIRMVETIMVQHGFVDGQPDKAARPSAPPAKNGKRQDWIRVLASALRMQQVGVYLRRKAFPQK